MLLPQVPGHASVLGGERDNVAGLEQLQGDARRSQGGFAVLAANGNADGAVPVAAVVVLEGDVGYQALPVEQVPAERLADTRQVMPVRLPFRPGRAPPRWRRHG
jgi:hypothetical protein